MIFNTFKKALDSNNKPYTKVVAPLDIISADGGKILIDGSQLSGTEFGFIDGVTAGTGAASKALVLGSTLKLSVTGSSVGAFLTVHPAVSGAGLKIHTHLNENNSGGTYDYTYMNELKGEFVSTSGTMVGLGADYTLSGSGTGAMCASSGYAKLLTGITMSGAAMPTAGVLTGGQFFANIAGTVNGAGCAVIGLYGGIDYNTGGTLTTCDYITGIRGEYRSNIDCGTGTSSIMSLVKGGTAATAVDYGIHMTASNGTITTGLYMTGATLPIDVNSATMGANGRIAKLYGSSAATGMADGYGAVEIDLTVTGTAAGPYVTASSTWINMAASSTAGSNLVCVQNNGIYAPATGTPLTTATCILGMRMHLVIDGGDDPTAIYLFSTNISANALTAMFHVNAAVDVTWAAGTKSGGTAGNFPIFHDVSAGVTHYVNTYTA